MRSLSVALLAVSLLSTPSLAEERDDPPPPPELKVQMNMNTTNNTYTAVSNVLKTKHDTAKNSIGNVR
jgi:hypothetical protein